MARYIDADRLKRTFASGIRVYDGMCKIADVMHNIENEPTAEVAEVVHGCWKDGIYCSVCGDLYDTREYSNARNYCPNCGAKMEERTVESSYAKVLKSYQEQLIQSYGENFIDECVKNVAKSYKGSEEKKMNQSRGEKSESGNQKAEIERYKGVIKILESDVAKTKVDTTKEFAKYLIDNDEDGVIKTIDLPELVCDFLHPVEKVEHDSLCETETYKARKG